LIILGHGDPDSTIIASGTSGGLTWMSEQLYTLLYSWLVPAGKMAMRVQRISLHMCYGGGNKGNLATAGSASRTSQFIVPPSKSFAQKFASIAGTLTVDVTARTDTTNMVPTTRGGTFVTAVRNVAGRHHGEGDKFVFTTVDGSSPTNPREATRHATWK